MVTSDIRFTPVRGTTEAIARIPYTEGNLYFNIDDHTIWLDSNDYRIPMGSGESSSGSGIIIGNKTLTFDEEELSEIDFVVADLNISYLPSEDAIILNVPDGCFYRVISVNDDLITAQRLTVAGGGSGAEEPTLSVSIDSSTLDSYATLVYGQDYKVSVTGTAINGNTDRNVSLIFSFTGDNGYSEVFTERTRSGIPYELNLNFLPINNNITMTVSVDSDNANMHKLPSTKKSGIKVVDMRVEKSGSDYIPLQEGPALLDYIPYGEGLNVVLHTAIDDEEFENNVRLTQDNLGHGQSVSIPAQLHGTYTVSLWLTTEVNRTVLSSDKIYYEVAWAQSGDMDADPLIWIGDYAPTTILYETATIPYMVMDPSQKEYGLPAEVHFYHEGIEISTSPINVLYSREGWYYWDITALYDVGENQFGIQCGHTRKDIIVNITEEGSRNLKLVRPEGLILQYDSIGRSSLETKTNRSSWESKVEDIGASADKYHKAIFNNFNWYNNGWKDDGDGSGSYLSVANDASLSIPFRSIAINQEFNYTFEIRFRVRNIQKYSTLVTQIPLYKYYDENGVLNAKGEELSLEEIEAHGYTVKLDDDGNKEMEQSNPTRKIVEKTKGIAFKYLNNDGYGFAIGTQEAYFATSGRVVNVRYKEDEIINISFVVDKENKTLYIYLNGILSGAANLNNVPSFTMQNIPFVINSEYCDFDLYKFRIYQNRSGLTMPEVIHNYLSDMRDISLYDENQLTDVNDSSALDYNKLVQYNADHPDNPTMPYAVIDMSEQIDDRLPYVKAEVNTKVATITFVNPTLDRLLETEQISEETYYSHCPSFTADNVDINVQGTSSQGYPRRNYKTKFKKAENWVYTKGELAGQLVNGVPYEKDGKIKYKDHTLSNGSTITKKWHMDNADLGTDKFTWKIDYMESSGSYNTGFANMMGLNLYNKHPLDDLGFNASGKNYRTTIYGFPILVFHKKKDGTYTYVGRYNLNLDKGSNEYYGFEESAAHPYVEGKTIAEVAECWELRDNQGDWCSFKYPNQQSREEHFGTWTPDATEENPKLEVALHFEPRYHVEGDEIEAAAKYTHEINEKDFSATIGTNNASYCQYLRTKMANLEVMFNWLDSTDTTTATNHVWTVEEGGPRRIPVISTISGDETVTYETVTENNLPITYGTFTADTREYRRQKFRAEFSQHFDPHYCAIYYIMTELLLCYDSRGKNMMIATWGPHEQGGDYIWYPIFYDIDTQLGLNNVGALLWDYNENATENKTFSTAESVLWVNFADMFKTFILSTYAALRSGSDNAKLSYNNIEGSYTCNPRVFRNSYAMRGKRPIIAIGLDEYYKYLAPITSGYYDTAGTIQSGSSGDYLYACQGDRKLSRELFITNRLNYMDAKWSAGDYDASIVSQQIYLRSNVNLANTSDIYLDSVALNGVKPLDARQEQELAPYPVPYFDFTQDYSVTPFLDQYVTVFIDGNPYKTEDFYTSEKYPNGIKTTASQGLIDTAKIGEKGQQITYFPGGDFLSSLGDMSAKYIDSIGIYHGKRLLDITLGSDAPGYKNNIVSGAGTIFSLGDDANSQNKKTLLKKIVLTGLGCLDAFQDVSGSEKLQEFRALNTALPYAVFAKGAPLTTLHLPKSTTELRLAENKNLTRILRTKPKAAWVVDENEQEVETNDMSWVLNPNNSLVYADPEVLKGLYLEGTTDYNPNLTYTDEYKLTTIQTEGDALGYDSYELLRNAVYRKIADGRSLGIEMKDVKWTPFELVEYGEAYNSNVHYYLLTDHSTYDGEWINSWNYTESEWNRLTLNEKIYTYDSSKNKSIIPNLDLLNIFKIDYDEAAQAGVINQFTNTSGEPRATKPTLTGEIYIANNDPSEDAISEDVFTNVYAKYWPNLTIRAEKVLESYIAKFILIDDSTGKENEYFPAKRFAPIGDDNYTDRSPEIYEEIPSKPYHTFVGWALDAEGTKIVYNYNLLSQTLQLNNDYANDPDFIFTQQNKVITLYAIFTKTLCGVEFYYTPDDNPGTAEQLIVLDPSNPQELVIGKNVTKPVTMLVPYDSPLPEMTVIPHKVEGNDKPLTFAYVFSGWANSEGELQTLTNKTVKQNLVYHAVFSEESDIHAYTDNPLLKNPSQYFDIDDNGYISVASGVKLSGKVIIPNVIPTNNGNKTVQGIKGSYSAAEGQEGKGFYNQNEITHIFLQDPATSQLKIINQYGVGFSSRNATKLRYIELPTTGGVRICTRAFNQANLLFSNIDLPNTQAFFKRISYIEPYAFYDNRYGFTEGFYLYSNILAIGSSAFNNDNRGGTILQLGSAEEPITYNSNMYETNNGKIFAQNNNTIQTIIIYTNDDTQTWDNVMSTTFGLTVTPTYPLLQG